MDVARDMVLHDISKRGDRTTYLRKALSEIETWKLWNVLYVDEYTPRSYESIRSPLFLLAVSVSMVDVILGQYDPKWRYSMKKRDPPQLLPKHRRLLRWLSKLLSANVPETPTLNVALRSFRDAQAKAPDPDITAAFTLPQRVLDASNVEEARRLLVETSDRAATSAGATPVYRAVRPQKTELVRKWQRLGHRLQDMEIQTWIKSTK